VHAILEDLANLPPKRLERRLEELAREALPCVNAVVFDGTTVYTDVRSAVATPTVLVPVK